VVVLRLVVVSVSRISRLPLAVSHTYGYGAVSSTIGMARGGEFRSRGSMVPVCGFGGKGTGVASSD